jgi:hypothetical protein
VIKVDLDVVVIFPLLGVHVKVDLRYGLCNWRSRIEIDLLLIVRQNRKRLFDFSRRQIMMRVVCSHTRILLELLWTYNRLGVETFLVAALVVRVCLLYVITFFVTLKRHFSALEWNVNTLVCRLQTLRLSGEVFRDTRLLFEKHFFKSFFGGIFSFFLSLFFTKLASNLASLFNPF